MGLLDMVGQGLGALGGIAGNRGENEFRTPNQSNFNLPGYQQGMNQRAGLADQYGRQGSQFSGQQGMLAGMLMQQARGQGPSLADMQMQRGMQQAQAQQQSMAASGRGNAALGARQAMQNTGNAAQQLAGQGAMARVAEQRQAQGLLGNVLQGARGQDINQQQANSQAQLQALQQQLQLQQLQQGGMMGYEQQRGNRFNSLTQVPTNQEQGIGMVSPLLAMLGV
jgi:hypothetical protein